MKILFISHTYPPITGGVETQNYELYTNLSKSNEVTLLANRKRWMIPIFILRAACVAVFTAHKYDIILLGSCLLGNVGWIVKCLRKTPVAAIAHGLDLTWKNKFYQTVWVGMFIPKLDKLIAVGNETIRVGVGKGIPQEKFVFIPNGVDTEKHLCPTNRSDLQNILPIDISNKKVLLTSGRLAKRKGVVWFITNVMPKLAENIVYVVAGDGPDKQNIEQAIRDNNLDNRVVMLGYVPDEVRNVLMNASDLFIQPNIKVEGDMEGFGISVIEAASCKLPVLASNMEGLKDAIKHEQNGFLIEAYDSDGYVQKINELLADDTKRKEFGEHARTYVVEHYSWHFIAQQYMQELTALVPTQK